MSGASTWARWDPHIHTPGTALADAFSGDWDGYFNAIEAADPPVAALGITDYWSVRGYEEFLRRRGSRLSAVRLVFPNIEMRATPRTSKGQAINLHLLVSPEEADHITVIKRLLGQLHMEVRNKQQIACDFEGLVDLGRIHTGDAALEAEAAYRTGVEQFKIDAGDILDWYDQNSWLHNNALLAVAGGNDGLSGIRRDGGFREVHDLLVRKSHLVFSATPSDVLYYSGRDSAHADELDQRYDGPRPCIHGSDAHRIETVLAPDKDRFCWIKAVPTFDGLRQAQYEPQERVHIGTSPPSAPDPDRIISALRVFDHDGWFLVDEFRFSEGLNAIIGEKGTGKTALADLLAFATGSWRSTGNSFLEKAGRELGQARIEVEWKSGRRESCSLAEGCPEPEQTRYLSQQFVEQLCVDDALGEKLLSEIERVIFDHIPEERRLQCSSFPDLRQRVTSEIQRRRRQTRARVTELSEKIERVLEDERQLPEKEKRLEALKEELSIGGEALRKLMAQASPELGKKAEALAAELADLEKSASKLHSKLKTTDDLLKRVQEEAAQLDEFLADVRDDLASIGIQDDAANAFIKRFVGSPLELLAEARRRLAEDLEAVEGPPPADGEVGRAAGNKQEPADGHPAARTVASVRAELKLLQAQLNLDQQRTAQVSRLHRDQARRKANVAALNAEIVAAKQEKSRLPLTRTARKDAYLCYFDQIDEERKALEELYSPIANELETRSTGERELSFDVLVHVNVDDWAARGEEMLDLRRGGPFADRGALREYALKRLLPHWERCDREALGAGLQDLADELRKGWSPSQLRSGFSARDIAEWLYSVEHIELRYTLKYQGIPLRLLSPGTRGIVLLILYLAVDHLDDRPLIVDQPEENLDNASVFSVLVRYFRAAKQRRQVVVVTHNPNLVVNTDAELVVVASAARRESGLPQISYDTGALEFVPGRSIQIRSHVCNVLEGGAQAFQNRERRYALRSTRPAEERC